MESNLTLSLANFSTLFVCMVLKFPQIFVLIRARAAAGVSLNSLVLELLGEIPIRTQRNSTVKFESKKLILKNILPKAFTHLDPTK
ncbi:hypothetical protein DNTS_021085 [Danionella cerebrum]|uniref:Uncharacterized protein n=1 Tax=Danionella cerebrum TaxID=2873325 RepID=A0A553R9F1_9TELE|nr:hypothetical protein DNTS_021085 [Danionella translucida]TRY98812.1 hypothetical protein DNTS_021085 [Danionella translucida]